MNPQSINQTINVVIGGDGSPVPGSLSNTGTPLTLLLTGLAVVIIAVSLIIWRFKPYNKYRHHLRNTKLSSRFSSILSIFAVLALTAFGLNTNLFQASAAPALSIAANQDKLTVNIPQGGGKADAITTITTGTANSDGYKLTAQLSAPEPGIDISLTGGDVASSTPLNTDSTPLTLKTTSSATSNDQTEVSLKFTIDGTVKPGTKQLNLTYTVIDNQPTAPAIPTTMQNFTSDYCQNSMSVYDGTNEEAVITLTDTRGDNQTYEVAKLADGNCWMLNNLKLGSATSSLTLTPADSNVGANFTLPQLYAGTGSSYLSSDLPFAFGPVPSATGSGATNYGYLYNWSAATAGESRTSHPETAGNAPYSICPANWRLPIGGAHNSGDGEFAALDVAFGGTGMSVGSGEPNIAKWQHDGPFKGVFAGYWYEGFSDQGGVGGLWSSSAYPGGAGGALSANFSATGVAPGGGSVRDYGIAVRCLLN